MLQRTSCVDTINIKIASFSSTVQLGDSCIINGLSRALAVQREADVFYGNEGNLSSYRVFSEPIPFLPIDEPFSYSRQNPNPLIKVSKIDIIGISSSSLLHVGNSRHVSMEARVKHIRQLLPIPRKEEEVEEQGQR
ncbi:spore germination protein GerPE [Bacillus sp. ISL-40]|uniref:spore germination protein GerPE n=1 Tax=unclassified Bacillus (in: firmicutes) TaxID=185979 RepID=UPI001BEC049A|nr:MULTISPECIES: spore germination protein GerPE [unclassified Bacillus (in: firmicutes)]MBT2697072.1 spore germination protein GerPE [Bacillus sp. ISL-40]MBT2721764.1 spore germination protein GerPE [Bacillus sp. ISL-46]MBT2740387.1 spore germination protein GerPE [Bacillus sp. ISL-77]